MKLPAAKGTPFETEFLPKRDAGVRCCQAKSPRHCVGHSLRWWRPVRRAVFQGPSSWPMARLLSWEVRRGRDNRIQSVGRYGGNVISSQARNRTATFVFYLGRDHFGTLTAYVPGSASDKFRFTPALPVQVLKGMAPVFGLLSGARHTHPVPGATHSLNRPQGPFLLLSPDVIQLLRHRPCNPLLVAVDDDGLRHVEFCEGESSTADIARVATRRWATPLSGAVRGLF